MRTRVIPIPLRCEHCAQWHHPVVRWDEDEEPYVARLAAECFVCGHPLGTPAVVRDLIGTARNIVETSHIIRGES